MSSNPISCHPVDFFNDFGSFESIFDGDKAAFLKSNTEACYPNPEDLQDDPNAPTYIYSDKTGRVSVMKSNPHRITKGELVSKFHLLAHIKFKGDLRGAESHVMYKVMDLDIPYIRVGTNYFKLIEDENRWGATNKMIEPWSKEALTDDHTKNILKIIPKYDKFGIFPSNTEYVSVYKNQFNLYCPFPHTPHTERVSISDIPISHGVMQHVFGDQIAQGYKYMKLLYEYPKQMLHILTLVSEERETGKTTVLNWIQMIFGENYVLINPQELTSNFNSIYATKNIIAFEEAAIDKSQSVEKLKSLSTGKSIAVSQKFIQGYQVPFFGKIIMCTNKVRDFMRVDMEENRFWVRKIKPLNEGKRNTNIEEDLFREIPLFLRYLQQLPVPDFSKSRFVLTREEIGTIELDEIKEESKSGLRKEIEMSIEDFFHNSDESEFYADAKDIKEHWFSKDNNITKSYIRKVLFQEMKMVPTAKVLRYYPFEEKEISKSKVSHPFLFKRAAEKIDNNQDAPKSDHINLLESVENNEELDF